jgi:hypothetical protein
MMKKSLHYIGFFILLFICWSCKQYDDLPELEYNRWVEQIPNPIQIDSIRLEATDSLSADVRVYLQFDRAQFESEWDAVQEVRVEFTSIRDPNEPSKTSIVNLDADGAGFAARSDLKTEASYEMRHQIELANGRTSVWSRSFTIDTPSF